MRRAETSAPTISVCIPTYRGLPYLAEAIESVLAQYWTDFELLVIDDHSLDQTAAVVQAYADPRIRFLQNLANLGPQGNWNRCLQEARGRYIKLLPQDDTIAPDCLAQQLAVLERDTTHQIALVFCTRNIIDAHAMTLLRLGYGGRPSGVVAAKALLRHCVRRGTNLIGEPGGVLFRRQLALSVGAFDASIPYVLDLDYWFRLLRHGDAYYLAQPLASFRLSRGSWSVAIGARQSADFRRFLRHVATDPGYALRWFDIRCGTLMARLNNVLRLAIYRLAVR